MSKNVVFVDNSIAFKNKIVGAGVAWLYEAAGEVKSQAQRNTRVDRGQLKGSWDYKVDEGKGIAIIGSPLENAIWEEFGTGEYALNGDGRKGGWLIPESKLSNKAKSKMRRVERGGKVYYFTRGKKPQRMLHKAFESTKGSIIERYKKIVKDNIK